MVDIARTMPLVMSVYLRKLLVPVGITGLYYTPYVTAAILGQVVAPAVVLGAALVLWRTAKYCRCAGRLRPGNRAALKQPGRAKEQKRGLMQKLLTGEIRV